MSVAAISATPELRMRAANQPLEVTPFEKGGSQRLTVGDVQRPEETRAPKPVDAAQPSSFGDLLAAGIQKTNELGHVAHGQAEAFARGALDDLHGTLITGKQAEISLRLVGSVRTKLLDAFHELWRINV
jgi:flagellar hook-basal body complex protein FliE